MVLHIFCLPSLRLTPLLFFHNYGQFYIIPLAKKLKECQVFGVSSDEYRNYAEKNRVRTDAAIELGFRSSLVTALALCLLSLLISNSFFSDGPFRLIGRMGEERPGGGRSHGGKDSGRA